MSEIQCDGLDSDLIFSETTGIVERAESISDSSTKSSGAGKGSETGGSRSEFAEHDG